MNDCMDTGFRGASCSPDSGLTPDADDIARFKVLYERYKDRIDEVLELAELYHQLLGPKKMEEAE